MPNEGGRAVPVFTIIGIIVFLVTVAILIRSYPNDDQVQAAPPAAASGAATVEATTELTPVGGVATGGGGTAGESSDVPLPVLSGLAAVTLVAIAGLGLWRSRPVGGAVV